MKVIRAGILGFCKGVRRAVDMAWQASFCPGSRVYTIGPLIHNSRVLESLRELGVVCLEEGEVPAMPQDAVVIIRAHGVSPAVERDLSRRGTRVIDATCPHVKVSQNKAGDFAEKGYRVFLAGEENHAEIIGLRGYVFAALAAGDKIPFHMRPERTHMEDASQCSAGQCCFVVGNGAEAETAAAELYRREPQAKTALIGQTTISPEEYQAISEKIRRFFPSLDIMDSICSATSERQKALRELCGKTDAVIIVGSKESANTQRLFSLARKLGKPSWFAETPADLPPEIGAYKTVGISAGASTPDELIDEIEEALKVKAGNQPITKVTT